jgi:hypothetical protein
MTRIVGTCQPNALVIRLPSYPVGQGNRTGARRTRGGGFAIRRPCGTGPARPHSYPIPTSGNSAGCKRGELSTDLSCCWVLFASTTCTSSKRMGRTWW